MVVQRVTVVCAAVLVAISAVAFGESLPVKATDRSAPTERRTLSPGRVVALSEQARTALPRPLNKSEVRQLANPGDVVGAPVGSIRVYGNEVNPVTRIYSPGANQRIADDLQLANGACNTDYYNVAVYGTGPVGTSFNIHTELWPGDPCTPGLLPIAGTAADFTATITCSSTIVPCPSADQVRAFELEATLAGPTSIPATVWLAATFSRTDAFWIIADQAEIGSTQNFFSENDTDLNPDVCALFSFAGPTAPYAGFWANVYCEVAVPPEGACCDGFTCTQTTQADCALPDEWQGAFTSCQPNPCLTGACCTGVDFEDCADTNELGCPDGLFRSGTVCIDDPCGESFEAYKNSFETGIFVGIDANTKFGDDLTLGVDTPCQLVAYEVLMAGGDTSPATFDARVELWTNNDRGTPAVDGDDVPLAAIPGTQRDFNGLAAGFSLQRLLAGPFTDLECPKKVWMVITTNTNHAGPIFGGLADIGFSQDGFAVFNDPSDPNMWTPGYRFPPNGFDPTNCPGAGCVPAGSFRAIVWCEGEATVAGACCLADPMAPGGVECQDTTLSVCDARNGSLMLGASCAIVDCLASACSSAAQIVGEGMFPFDNTNATTDGPVHTDCANVGGDEQIEKDVWFCWTSPCSDRVFVRTCGQTTVDTKIAVYGGCTCPPTEGDLRDCADDSCGLQSAAFFSSIAGANYLIRVGSYPGASGGIGTFSITCGPPNNSACPGGGNCCQASGARGCADETCCETVCACDSFCCDVEWDQACATFGFQNNGCGAAALCSSFCGPATGSCCDGTSGVCADDVLAQDCVGNQSDWAMGVACVERDPACAEHTGACCDLLEGVCTDDMPGSECTGSQRSWTKGAGCVDTACDAATGACCNHDPFGGCTDGTARSQCDCAQCEWTKLGQCADIECAHSSIPTIGGWGLVILSLLLLTGAKVRFGRVRHDGPTA